MKHSKHFPSVLFFSQWPLSIFLRWLLCIFRSQQFVLVFEQQSSSSSSLPMSSGSSTLTMDDPSIGIPIENSSGTLACLAQHNNRRSNSNSASQTLGNTSRTLKRDRPFCTHCNFHGHTVDKCYKLHGYPPGYKPRPRIPPVVSGSINQVSTLPHPADPPQSPGNTVTSLNTTQCQQLIAMLSSQLSAISTAKEPLTPAPAQAPGTCLSITLDSTFFQSRFWIVDSGASRHICCNREAFVSLHPINHSSVTLPNHDSIRASFSGDVLLGGIVLLRDVLYLPQFKFNLLSVSSMATANNLISFLFTTL
ncbi:hypothetical protein DH2020_002720 [Rehmannia glutinosa]|uniref:Retrovirus-related Pol polyprotein from transposon TNT 1-94-like beta-barrel domain-containing protein n=1 Tax=Rehmannia glutinosa TaxID=99300 RepID=A0ABR0XUT6_REHGL